MGKASMIWSSYDHLNEQEDCIKLVQSYKRLILSGEDATTDIRHFYMFSFLQWTHITFLF